MSQFSETMSNHSILVADGATETQLQNAGLPHLEGSDTVYEVSPQVMAEYALKFRDAGVKIFGGCCGSTPDHIRAAESILK